MCDQFMCSMSLMRLICVAKNVGHNIKCEETYSREACTCDEVMSFGLNIFYFVTNRASPIQRR